MFHNSICQIELLEIIHIKISSILLLLLTLLFDDFLMPDSMNYPCFTLTVTIVFATSQR